MLRSGLLALLLEARTLSLNRWGPTRGFATFQASFVNIYQFWTVHPQMQQNGLVYGWEGCLLLHFGVLLWQTSGTYTL